MRLQPDHLLRPLHRPEANPRDESRRRRRNARNALLKLVASVGLAAGILVPGVETTGAMFERRADAAPWVDAMADQTADVVAALPFATIEALDQGALLDWRVPGEPAFHVEFSVSPVSTGLRVHATLVDHRTREALRDFVAWRGRT